MPPSRGTVVLHTRAHAAAERQAGVVSRQQLLAWGWTSEEIQGQIRARRWRRMHRGVYWTATGPPSREALQWAALLAFGDGAVLCGRTAAELWGFGPVGAAVCVAVPMASRTRQLVGVHVRRMSGLEGRTHGRFDPPRTTVEDTVLDLVEESDDDNEAMGWLTGALQNRKTTPPQLLASSLRRTRLRRRALVEVTCGYARDGATTPLEIGWVRRVERPHGLPRARRQARGTVDGRVVLRDVAYEEFGLFVELDGRLGHETAGDAFRDMHRDNAAVLDGRATLRFGWTAVMSRSCVAAAQVAGALRARGWTGQFLECGPDCTAVG